MSYIIAVDFDGTLCENMYPEIGKPHDVLINELKVRKDNGDKIILDNFNVDIPLLIYGFIIKKTSPTTSPACLINSISRGVLIIIIYFYSSIAFLILENTSFNSLLPSTFTNKFLFL